MDATTATVAGEVTETGNNGAERLSMKRSRRKAMMGELEEADVTVLL